MFPYNLGRSILKCHLSKLLCVVISINQNPKLYTNASWERVYQTLALTLLRYPHHQYAARRRRPRTDEAAEALRAVSWPFSNISNLLHVWLAPVRDYGAP
jgi:hypothetical protein